jgi:dTDP-4-amino-4,6-dideoxygalactose transaminase
MPNSSNYITFAKPSIGEEEISAVAESMRSGWLTTGPKTREFEIAFAEEIGVKHALAVNSATAGLHLAVEAAGIGLDDYVLMPVWTFTASAEVVRYLGAHPIFIDIDEHTLNIDIVKLEAAVKKYKALYGIKLKAIMPVHFAGRAIEMSLIIDLAKEHDLMVIEDAAHALPSGTLSKTINDERLEYRKIGGIGHLTVFSFYATKTLVTGEGGMIATNDDALASRIRVMRLHGINRDVWDRYTSKKPSWYYEVVAPGFKYNLTDIASSMGLVQLRKLNRLRLQRAQIAALYNQAFECSKFVTPLTPPKKEDLHSWHLYVIRLNLEFLKIDRNTFIEKMAEAGVGCSVHFIPLHLQPYWRDRYALMQDSFPVAQSQYERVLSLPIYPDMTNAMVEKVIMTVDKIIQENKNGT